ncbi:MAG: hypothetical protein AAB276_03670 [Pseudomonadota bacterium]
MSLKEDHHSLQIRKKERLAEQRAAALKANLKRRKDQNNARTTNKNTQDEIV